MADAVTIAPKAYRLFEALNGCQFDSSSEFAKAFRATYARLFSGSPWRGDSADITTWGYETGVIQKDGDRLIIEVKGPRPEY